MKMQLTVQRYDQSDCRAQCEPPAIEQKLLTQLGEHFFFIFFFFSHETETLCFGK